jgi:hypothetical protein
MFNLGHNFMNIFTVTDGYRGGYNETEIHSSCVEGEGSPSLLIAYHSFVISSELLSML